MRIEIDFTASEVDAIRAALRWRCAYVDIGTREEVIALGTALQKINRATRIETVYAGKYIGRISGVRPEDARKLLDELTPCNPKREPMTARLVALLEDRLASCDAYVLRLQEQEA